MVMLYKGPGSLPFDKKFMIKKISRFLIGVTLVQFLLSVGLYWIVALPLNEMEANIVYSQSSVEKFKDQRELLNSPHGYITFGLSNVLILMYIDKCIQSVEPSITKQSN